MNARERRAMAKLYQRRHEKNVALAPARRERVEEMAERLAAWHSEQRIIESLREAAEMLSWCARKMKELCAGRDDVAGVTLAASRAFDAMREVENRAAAKEGKP